MILTELIGKCVTNIYALIEIEQDWLDKSECYVELDGNLIIDIPYGNNKQVWIKELDNRGESLFKDLSDYPVYFINPEDKQHVRTEYHENKFQYIRNKIIKDFLWYDDPSEKGLIELDNGFIITETLMSPSGTGLAGLNYYESLEQLIKSKGNDFKRLTEKLKTN